MANLKRIIPRENHQAGTLVANQLAEGLRVNQQAEGLMVNLFFPHAQFIWE